MKAGMEAATGRGSLEEIELQELSPLHRGREGHDGGDGERDSPTKHLLASEAAAGTENAGGAGLWAFVIQAFPSLIVAGLGMVLAGVLLDVVQHWKLFIEISELFIMVPALLGLKGNLEMTLASRLSTAAHRGLLSPERRWRTVGYNLLAVQVQAMLVGLATAVFSIVMGVMFHHEISFYHSSLLVAASITTASLASFILGVLMSVIVVYSPMCNINPDNVAAPIAASLGDLVTLAILSSIGRLFYLAMRTQAWLTPMVSAGFLLVALPLSVRTLQQEPEVWRIISAKWIWVSMLVAMSISSLAGLVLERFVSRFAGLAVLAPIINGIGGNLGAIMASRLSTSYHTGIKERYIRTAAVLFALVVPLSLLFLTLINVVNAGHTSMTPFFMTGYLFAALFQVLLLLVATKKIVKFVWECKQDPDNIAIPLVTALGDFLGTAALTLCFLILFELGDHDADVGD